MYIHDIYIYIHIGPGVWAGRLPPCTSRAAAAGRRAAGICMYVYIYIYIHIYV